jgi:hypothetical protein
MRPLLLLSILIACAPLGFGASQVAKYEFSSTLVSTDTDPTSVAGVFNNVGLGASTFNLTVGNPFPSIQDNGGDITDGSPPTPGPNATTTDYFTFTITPAAGVTLDYSTLSFDMATLTTGNGNNSFVISLQTSLNSFANLASATVTGTTTFQNVSWDLSSLPDSPAAAEFRLVIRDNTTSTTRGILLDNVSLTANVNTLPIPEPSTYMLMGFGLLLGAQRLRRKR